MALRKCTNALWFAFSSSLSYVNIDEVQTPYYILQRSQCRGYIPISASGRQYLPVGDVFASLLLVISFCQNGSRIRLRLLLIDSTATSIRTIGLAPDIDQLNAFVAAAGVRCSLNSCSPAYFSNRSSVIYIVRRSCG